MDHGANDQDSNVLVYGDNDIDLLYPVGGEEDSYQVQLKASTPIMVFRMRPVVSMLIKSFQ